MPFIEIQGPPVEREVRSALARGATGALVAAYSIDPSIVTIYFVDIRPTDYAHAGVPGGAPEDQRVFVKVYAFPRSIELRRVAARTLTEAICAATGWAGKTVIVYFIEVTPGAAAHAGVLQSDHTTEPSR
jgi:phenylpyruvate tautomerase PptA (4-oxalocrotonate tautomerase family)